jgi:hypothetical protein
VLLTLFLTCTSYTKNPFSGRINANVAEVFEPTAFWAIVTASLRVVLTFEYIAPLIVGPRGIDPVMLGGGGAFGRFPWVGFVVVVPAVVAFLDPALTPYANTSELAAVKSIVTAATTIAPYTSTFLLTIFEFVIVVVVVIAIKLTELLL